jgi:hypothetical protein
MHLAAQAPVAQVDQQLTRSLPRVVQKMLDQTVMVAVSQTVKAVTRLLFLHPLAFLRLQAVLEVFPTKIQVRLAQHQEEAAREEMLRALAVLLVAKAVEVNYELYTLPLRLPVLRLELKAVVVQ